MLLRKISFAKKAMEIFKKKVCFYTFMGLIDESSISTRMTVLDSFESLHQDNIRDLVLMFGEERREEIEETYNQAKRDLEENSTIPDFIPRFAYRRTRDILEEKY